LKLICSAFVAGATQDENARKTTELLIAASVHTQELVQGRYEGTAEIAVQITGFESFAALLKFGAKMCKQFKQACVYYSLEGVGYLLHASGRHETLGPEEWYTATLVQSPTFRSIYKNYTVYADGSAIAARPH
jgi:hypothetical protein